MLDLELELLRLQVTNPWDTLCARFWDHEQGQLRIAREWVSDNRAERRAYMRAYLKRRRATDPAFVAKERKRQRDKYHRMKKEHGGKYLK